MNIIGHQKQLKLLRGFLKNNLFFSSYLFWGPEKTGKKLVALEFTKGLLCRKGTFGGCLSSHPFCPACADLRRAGSAFVATSANEAGSSETGISQRDFLLVDENFLPGRFIKSEDEKPYGIDTSRAVISFLSTSPSIAQRKVVLIDNAHLLTQEAQNSLLKTIEEPPSNAVVILVSHKPSFLYDTVISRVLQVYFSLVSGKELLPWIKSFSPANAKEANEIVRFSLGRPGRAAEFVNDKKLLSEFRKDVLKLLSFEGKTSGQKLILLKNFFAQTADLAGSFSLWQGLLRDELMFSCGFEDLAVILSQKRRPGTADLVVSLKKLLDLSNLSDGFPATAEAAFKQMVLSKSL